MTRCAQLYYPHRMRMDPIGTFRRGAVRASVLWLVLASLFGPVAGCSNKRDKESRKKAKPEPSRTQVTRSLKKEVDIGVAYSSEISLFMVEAIDHFNASRTAKNGKYIVTAHGTEIENERAVNDILDGSAQPHVWVPSSDIYRVRLNRAWEERYRRGADIAPDPRSLAHSPVVIAMWKPQAEALGWPNPLGWADIRKLADDARGWAGLGHPEWGAFKLGVPEPGVSSVGLLAFLSMASGAPGGQLDKPAAQAFVRTIERAAVHYSPSETFFFEKMMARGPTYLSAAIVPENLVFASYQQSSNKKPPHDLVAIYPTEGTLSLDHPVVIMDAVWVEDEHKEASRAFRDFLLGAEMQQLVLLRHGLRPADPGADRTALKREVGVDGTQPQKSLPALSPEAVASALTAWPTVKKQADVVLVFDGSAAMAGESADRARQTAVRLLDALGPGTRADLLLANGTAPTSVELADVEEAREALKKRVQESASAGQTTWRDAIALAHQSLARNTGRERIRAVIVLVAGPDEQSATSMAALTETLGQGAGPDQGSIPVFIVGYGPDVDVRAVTRLAEASGGRFVLYDARSRRKVSAELAAYL